MAALAANKTGLALMTDRSKRQVRQNIRAASVVGLSQRQEGLEVRVWTRIVRIRVDFFRLRDKYEEERMGQRSRRKSGSYGRAPKTLQESIASRSGKWVTIIKWTLGIGGWLVSVALGVLQLPEKITSFSEHLPEAHEVVGSRFAHNQSFRGRFSSDIQAWTERNLIGPETTPKDVGVVQFDLTYLDKGRYEGEFYSRHLSENSPFPWSRVMVDGYVTATGTFRGTVWDIVQNQRVNYSSFTLDVIDPEARVLRLKPDQEGDPVLPEEIHLWPTDYEMAEGESGKQFTQMLRESRQRVAPHLLPGQTYVDACNSDSASIEDGLPQFVPGP